MTEPQPELPHIRLETRRLVVRTAEPADGAAIVAYYGENRERFLPFDPERPSIFYEPRFWAAQIRQNVEDLAADRAARLFLFRATDPGRVSGTISLTQIVRGVSHSCTLGYSLAGEAEGQGLMSEALGAVIEYAFGTMNLHRIEANHVPDNRRSGDLLRRMGFVEEGYSRDYLRIAGRWRDHIRTALLNPDWVDGAG